MNAFDFCIEVILAEEGGLVTHPNDPGGTTKYGISQRAYPKLDIRAITLDDAKALYKRDYWNPIKGDELPQGMNLLMLDCAVNQGTGTAIKLLQEAAQVRVDGAIGEMTIRYAQQQMPGIMERFAALRAWRYEINRNEDVFGKGWFRRLFRVYTVALMMFEKSQADK